MNWTPEQLQAEWDYRYAERVGILCGQNKVTLLADFMAQQEADEALKNLTDLKSKLENG